MKDCLYRIPILIIFASVWVICGFEFILTVTTHDLLLRFAMCHSLVIGLLIGGLIYGNHFIETKKKVSFANLWLTVCAIAMCGFCFSNLIHALKMWIHPHDSGIHHLFWLSIISFVDIVVKLATHPTIRRRTDVPQGKLAYLLFLLPGVAVLSLVASGVYEEMKVNGTSLVEVFSSATISYDTTQVKVDIALTILICLVAAGISVHQSFAYIPILMLSSPREIDHRQLLRELNEKFSTINGRRANIHELHLWGDCGINLSASVHLKLHGTQGNINGIISQIREHIGEPRHIHRQDITIQLEVLDFEEPWCEECMDECVDECQSKRCC